MNELIKTINQVSIFVLEIAMLISLGYYGMSQSWNLVPRLVCTTVLIIFTVFIWSVYAAPRSVKRLKMPFLIIFRAALFLIAFYLLYHTGHIHPALIFAGLTIITQIISYLTEKKKLS